MEKIILSLSIEETNVVLQSLGNMPYLQVHQVIQKIQQQAAEQLNELQEKQKEKSAKAINNEPA